MNKIKTTEALGQAIRQLRKHDHLKATDVAAKAKRSRGMLYRLETGQDVSVSALMDILRATGYAIELVPAGLPTMEQMRSMFAEEEEDEDDDNAPRENPPS